MVLEKRQTGWRGGLIQALEGLSGLACIIAYFKTSDLIYATKVVMALTTLTVIIAQIIKCKLTKLQIGTWLVVLILGALTISFQNEQYVKWKTSVINACLALILIVNHLITKENFTQRALCNFIKAPDYMLRKMHLAIAAYFSFIAISNFLVAHFFDTDTWFKFKYFGLLAINLSFICACLYYLRKYLPEAFDSEKKK